MNENIKKKYLDSPILKNITAHIMKVGIIFVNQILLIPLYIIYMGKNLYGDWIVLTAISQFFVLSDFGLNAVSSNAVNSLPREGGLIINKKRYASYVVNCFVMISLIAIAVEVIIIVSGCFLNLPNLFGLRELSNSDTTAIIALLLGQVFLYMLNGTPEIILNASHKAHIGTHFNNFIKLSNALIIAVGIISKIPLIVICVIHLIPSLIALFYKIHIAKQEIDFNLSLNDFDKIQFMELLKPSLSYMTFPVGNALLFQGFTFVVNAFFGASVLILFNTTRTMVNFTRSLIEIVSQGSRPEFGIAYGEKNYQKMKQIYQTVVKFSFLILFSIFSVLLVLGPYIYRVWTHGEIEFDFYLMLCFFFVITCNTIWNSQSITMLSTNNHTTLGKIFIVSCLLAVIASVILNNIYSSIYLCALCISISDIPLCRYATRKSNQIINTI